MPNANQRWLFITATWEDSDSPNILDFDLTEPFTSLDDVYQRIRRLNGKMQAEDPIPVTIRKWLEEAELGQMIQISDCVAVLCVPASFHLAKWQPKREIRSIVELDDSIFNESFIQTDKPKKDKKKKDKKSKKRGPKP